MYKRILLVTTFFCFALANLWPASLSKKGKRSHEAKEEITRAARNELWHAPGDIRTLNLFYGPGGRENAPHTTYIFVKEDLHGTSPKFKVGDENGVRWRVKLGPEARPETAASRLLWAVGYSTNRFYFVSELHVEGLPAHLDRGQRFVTPDGSVRYAELRRAAAHEKKIGDWQWRKNPFVGTREFNGLRVMMALLNNWDLKDDNNGVYEVDRSDGRVNIYRVTDIGASFGTSGPSWTRAMSKDNIKAYSRSPFIRKATSDYVDFNAPTRPCLKYVFDPPGFITRLRMRWIGRRIPRGDARWIGGLLAQLSPDQIRDAFRGSGYNPDEVNAHAQVVEQRIRELNKL